jgi:hypothetical protein
MTLASRRAVAVLRRRRWHGRMKAAQSSEALGSEHGRLELDLVANMITPAAAGLHHP